MVQMARRAILALYNAKSTSYSVFLTVGEAVILEQHIDQYAVPNAVIVRVMFFSCRNMRAVAGSDPISEASGAAIYMPRYNIRIFVAVVCRGAFGRRSGSWLERGYAHFYAGMISEQLHHAQPAGARQNLSFL